jgi:salicylate hydroxylase
MAAMDLTGLNVAVVGGGIGGTAAACALAQGGADVTLYEQAPALGEVGAGIQVSANGQCVLRALGAVGVEGHISATISRGTEFRDGAQGRYVTRVPAPRAGPTWYMHRADLLGLLAIAAEQAGVRTEFGRVVTPGSIEADLIVAADGVKSVWRSLVDGPDSPRFTGQVAWRALVPWDRGGDEAVLSMGHRAHLVAYPLRQGKLLNLVAVEEATGWTRESWSEQGDPDEMRARFEDFGGVMGEVLAEVGQVHRWALHLRPVAQRWHHQNVVLLGDAAHATLPFMAQGACLALEDAWVLRAALERAGDVKSGLQTYEDTRKGRAARVVGLARGNAWRFHMGKPFAWGAQAVLALGSGLLARQLDWVYDYDATRALG